MKSSAIKKIAVFCGANLGNSAIYQNAAKQLADVLQAAGITLVYGGTKVGLMGVLADHILSKGGHAIGVIPKSLVEVEIAHDNLTELHVVNSMQERKAMMAEFADAFVMLPGGPGSLDEFFEMMTWTQLGFHAKPCGILNVNGYYDSLLKFLDHVVAEGFMKSIHRNIAIAENTADALIQKLEAYQAPSESKWIKEPVLAPA